MHVIMFQSPTNRGSLSDASRTPACRHDRATFQSPTNRGSLSDADILHDLSMPEKPVSIPYQSGQSCRQRYKAIHRTGNVRFQSPTNRGSLSDEHGVQLAEEVARGFNPLPIGAVFPTPSPPPLARPRGSGCFNPLPIGAVFPTADEQRRDQPTRRYPFQSPTNRGSLSDRYR